MNAFTPLTLVIIFGLVSTAPKSTFEWLWSSLPPPSCVINFGYCKIECPACTVCYVNIIDCSEMYHGSSSSNSNRYHHSNPCIVQLSKCKRNCTVCGECYSAFMDCMVESESKKGLTPVNHSSSGGSTISDHRDNSKERVTGTDGDAAGDAGNTTTAWGHGIDIGIPGWAIFLVEEQIEEPPAKLEEDSEDASGVDSGNPGNTTTPRGDEVDMGMSGCPVFIVQEQTEEPPANLEEDLENASVAASGNSGNTTTQRGHRTDMGMSGCPVFILEEQTEEDA